MARACVLPTGQVLLKNSERRQECDQIHLSRTVLMATCRMVGGVRKGTPWTRAREESAVTALVGPVRPAHRKVSLTWNLCVEAALVGRRREP